MEKQDQIIIVVKNSSGYDLEEELNEKIAPHLKDGYQVKSIHSCSSTGYNTTYCFVTVLLEKIKPQLMFSL